MKTTPPPEAQTLPHVRAFLQAYPWAIRPEAFEALVEVVERRASGIRLNEEQIAAATAARRAPSLVAAPGSIAVLPLFGLISHRIHMVENISGPGGTSTEGFGRALDAALADPNVSAIVIDVDSPGGSVFGVQELGDKIHAARAQKPVVAVANAMAASAAYWLAAQAGELVITPSGEVGSLGVIAIHDDWSGAMEKEGIRRSYITAGKYKAEGNPTEPLGDEARSHLQSQVDDYYDRFVRAVARGRGASLSAVRETYGDGRMVLAAEAVRIGMADRLGTLEETIARYAKKAARAAGKSSRLPDGWGVVESIGASLLIAQIDEEAEPLTADERAAIEAELTIEWRAKLEAERERFQLQLELARRRAG